MEELDSITYKAFAKYYNTLCNIGYVKDLDVKSLIVLSSIQEALHNFIFYITEEDYGYLKQALYRLYGSNCIIDIPEYKYYDSLYRPILNTFKGRIDEDENLRQSENNIIRAI